MHNIFYEKLNISQKYPAIVIGLIKECRDITQRSAPEKIYNYVKKIEFSQGNYMDAEEVDKILAENLCAAAPKEVVALGATLKFSPVEGTAGGVIGNPHAPLSSAEGELEKINDSLYIVSFTGGPGLVFEVDHDNLETLKGYIKVSEGWPGIPGLIKGLNRAEVKKMIGVTDGSGSPNPGSILAYTERELSIIHL